VLSLRPSHCRRVRRNLSQGLHVFDDRRVCQYQDTRTLYETSGIRVYQCFGGISWSLFLCHRRWKFRRLDPWMQDWRHSVHLLQWRTTIHTSLARSRRTLRRWAFKRTSRVCWHRIRSILDGTTLGSDEDFVIR
jgi:hypothetical protein